MKRLVKYIISLFVTVVLCAPPAVAQPKGSPAPLSSARLADVQASSYVRTEKNDPFRYHPIMAFDGDPATAWNEGAEGSGSGESLTVVFSDEMTFDSIAIMPGYFDKRWYKANNRVKKLSITTDTSSVEVIADLADVMETQKVNFAPQKALAVKFTVLDVWPGDRYDDTCISEIAFYRQNRKITFTNIGAYKKWATARITAPPPAGFAMTQGVMFATIHYFFPDGVYVEELGSPGGHGIGNRIKGRWRLQAGTNDVIVDLTEAEVLEGIGKRVTTPALYGESVWYESYKYYIKKIKKTEKYERSIFKNFDSKEGVGEFYFYPLTFGNEEMKILPRPGYKAAIESLRGRYRYFLSHPEDTIPE